MSSSEPAFLSVRDLSARWDGQQALDRVSFDIDRGEFLVVLGPNGSGKSTLLRCIVGLERPTNGTVSLEGSRLDEVPVHRRGIGLLLQDPALFPRRTVWENVAYGLFATRSPRAEIDHRVDEVASLLQIDPLLDRWPSRLSGGERQRVALARALVTRPRLLLLDEPFASLDPEIALTLRAEFRSILTSQRITTIHVTHDREEGLMLADRVMLLREGRAIQISSPQETIDAPADPAAARFLGYNLLPHLGGVVAVLPEELHVVGGDGDGVPARVVASASIGRRSIISVRLSDGSIATVVLSSQASRPLPGSEIRLRWGRSLVFPATQEVNRS